MLIAAMATLRRTTRSKFLPNMRPIIPLRRSFANLPGRGAAENLNDLSSRPQRHQAVVETTIPIPYHPDRSASEIF